MHTRGNVMDLEINVRSIPPHVAIVSARPSVGINVTLSEADLEVVDKLRARVYHGQGMRFQRGGHTYEVRVDVSRHD